MRLFFHFFVVLAVCLNLQNSFAQEGEMVSREKALEIADGTEQVKIFREEISKYIISELEEKSFECVQHQIDELCSSPDECQWKIQYQLKDSCWLSTSRDSRVEIVVTVDKKSGEILAVTPKTEYIKDARYCQSDADCGSVSAAVVPFIYCINYFHAPFTALEFLQLNAGGGYDCMCIGIQCMYVNQHLFLGPEAGKTK